MLKIENLTFEYIKNTKVLNDLNCGYKEGLNIVFSNRGEGKTTLLNLILFPKRNQTNIKLFGENISKKVAQKEFSAILGDWFLKDNQTPKIAYENSKKHALLQEEFFPEINFEKIENQKIKTLSLSEKFKTALVRALKKCPSALVLDSPFLCVPKIEIKTLIQTLEEVISAYQKTHEKPLCVLLFSRPFDVGNKAVSFMQGGNIISYQSYEKAYNFPATTSVAINFAKYPNNVFYNGERNYYINGDMIKQGAEMPCRVVIVKENSMIIECELGDLEMPIIKGYKVLDEFSIDIPESAKVYFEK